MAKKMNKQANDKPVINYIDLLYMTTAQITAKDIADYLTDAAAVEVELWEEMNVLELVLSNDGSVDFEPLALPFKDPSDTAFVKNRKIQTVFAIQCKQTDLAVVKPYFEQLIEQFSGFVCADSEDFKPVYVGTI
ncbi:MAG: hypothetical protein K0S47_637 [Herbinix sp.]|jgi:hypothetical protein|nr:hypothetical protein [Herbinix sp.]